MNRFFLDNLWRWKCGIPEFGKPQNDIVSFKDLKKTEWSKEFEQLMRNRLIMDALRYGKIKAKNKPTYDRITSIIKRIQKYKESGNKEFLVDVANLCLLEFTECMHPNAHFNSIDDGEHVNISIY